MKTIETLAMDEEMALSPSGVNLDSPCKAADDAAIIGSESSDDESGLKDEILTNDSLEEALDKQLASLEEEEEQEETETAPDKAEEEKKTVEETVSDETDMETVKKDMDTDKTDKETVKTDMETEKTEMETDGTTEVEQTETSETEKDEKTTSDSSEEKPDEPMVNESLNEKDGITEELESDSKDETTENPSVKNIASTDEETVKSPEMKPGKISMEIVNEGDESSNDSASTKEDEDGVTPMEVVAEKAAEPEVQKTILNLEEGLNDLMKISQSFKTIDEEPSSETRDKPSTSGVKRAFEDPGKDQDQASVKRSKQDEDLKRSIKKKLRHLPRKEIEDLVAEKVVEMLSSRSELGELRRQCDAYKEKDEKWKRKLQALQKMCQDLNTVMRRYITDVQKEKEKVAPIKITRSVGLQVMTDRRRLAPALPPPTQVMATKRTQGTAPRLTLQPPQPQVTFLPPGVTVSRQQQTPPAPVRQMNQPVPILPRNPLPHVNVSPAAGVRPLPITNGVVANNIVRINNNSSGGGASKVIDVVDLDDDDDTPSAPAPLRQNQVVIPTGQVRVVPNNQTVTYAVVSNAGTATTMTGPNRVLIARPQQPGQVLVTRNGMGPVVARAPQVVSNVSRPVIVQGQVRQFGGQQRAIAPLLQHPAPLPDVLHQPQNSLWKRSPPKPKLKITRLKTGIVLSWNMDLSLIEHAAIAFYQIYAYQETGLAPNQNLWKKVGDVKSLQLPMACTLTQFTKGNKYHFAVRAQDIHSRVGQFSDPQSI